MAKKSSVEKNNRRRKLVKQFSSKRAALKVVIMNKESTMQERFEAVQKLSSLPLNSCKVRVRNRCETTGRPRGYYRKFRLSRIELRNLASMGQIPGVTKSSW